MSPILINGPKYSEMIMWLSATLPLNSYFVDGFDTGDNYIYMWANKEAFRTYTDDDYYFVHRGKLDIFNFSRAPGANDEKLLANFVFTNKLKRQFSTIINNGKFVPLNTTAPSTFAYSMSYNGKSIIVIGNLDFRVNAESVINVRKLTTDNMIIPIKVDSVPVTQRGKLKVVMKPGETIVLFVDDLEIK